MVDGALYVGGIDGRLYSLNIANGHVRWISDTGTGWVTPSPSGANGVLYEENAKAGVAALSEATGAELWTAAAGMGGTPAVANGQVFVGTSGPTVEALPAAGCAPQTLCAPLWSTHLHNYTPGVSGGDDCCGLAVANGVVFATATDSLNALSATTGKILWTAPFDRLGLAGMYISGPNVSNGVVYVGSAVGAILAFPASCSTLCSPIWERWVNDYSGGYGAPPIVVNGTLYEPGGAGVYAYRLPANGGTGTAPTTAPTNIAGTPRSCGVIDFTWQQPPAQYPESADLITASNGVTSLGAPFNQGEISNIPDGVALRYRVSAINAAGTGPASAWVGPYTVYCHPAPPKLTSVHAGHGSVTVGWTAPASDGGKPITGYQVQCMQQSDASAYANTSASARSATLTGLPSKTAYSCIVFAENAEGQSMASNFSAWVTTT